MVDTLQLSWALLPKLIDSGDVLIIMITSIATMGILLTATLTKRRSASPEHLALHATQRRITRESPVRLTEIAPGVVKTEFSMSASLVASSARTPPTPE